MLAGAPRVLEFCRELGLTHILERDYRTDESEAGVTGLRRCETCNDDGWVDACDDEGMPLAPRDCPHLYASWHKPFNASGLLNDGIAALQRLRPPSGITPDLREQVIPIEGETK